MKGCKFPGARPIGKPRKAMKPNQLEIRTNPVDGTIWAVRVQRGVVTQRIKDVTNDVLFCLCADLSAVNGTEHVERTIKFADGMECKITVEMVDG